MQEPHWTEPRSGLNWHAESSCMLVPSGWNATQWTAIDPLGSQWFRSPLDATYHLAYRMSDAPEGAQPLALFNLRRWLQSEPKGRVLRAQWWGARLEIAALNGTSIKFHLVQHAPTAEDAAYFVLLTLDQLDWNGADVPVFWEGTGSELVAPWTRHFIAHWHERSLDGILQPA